MEYKIVKSMYIINNEPDKCYNLRKDISDLYMPKIGEKITDIEYICDSLSSEVVSIDVSYCENRVTIYISEQQIDETQLRKCQLNAELYGFTFMSILEECEQALK